MTGSDVREVANIIGTVDQLLGDSLALIQHQMDGGHPKGDCLAEAFGTSGFVDAKAQDAAVEDFLKNMDPTKMPKA